MASLKEVKGRILSVNNTLKITSAMKMVASAKLRKAQDVIEGMLPYEQRMSAIMTHFLAFDEKLVTPFSQVREVKRAGLVVFSSNSSLCGGYNSNIIRRYRNWLEANASLGMENLAVYPIGRKITEAVRKSGITPEGDYTVMAGKPNYEDCAKLAAELCNRFQTGDLDRIDLIYHHFKSAGTQILTETTYLPIDLSQLAEDDSGTVADYIIEPTKDELIARLVPEVLKLKVYATLLDSNASEHAARSMAMQIASDNANNLIQDLTVVYNKGRQQAITNELLDIVGGTMA